MKPLYSPTTKGFYFKELHGKNIPLDVVSVTKAEYLKLISNQGVGDGYEIIPGADGKPETSKNRQELK